MKKNTLTLDTMNNIVQKQYTTEDVVIQLDGKEYIVKCDKKFKDSKIQEYIKEWMFIKSTYISDVEINMFDMSFILILKHFTDLPFENYETAEDKVDHYVRMTNVLFDLKDKDGVSIFDKVFSALDEEEVKRVSQRMTEVSKEILAKTEEMKEMAEMYKELEEVK